MIGVCSWSLQPGSPGDLVERARATGLHAVQLALDPILDGAWGEIETLNRLRSAGVLVLSGMIGTRGEDYSTLETIARTGGVRPSEHWDHNLRHATRAARLARRAGIPLVTLHAGFLPHDRADRERLVMLDRLRRLADVFDDAGVRLAFETGQESAETLLECLAHLDRPGVGVNFDPANMILYGMGEPVRALAALAPRVVQVHVKDAVAAGTPGQWGSEVPVGTGQVAWEPFFATLRERAVAADLLIEREAGVDRVADVVVARRLVERLGAA